MLQSIAAASVVGSLSPDTAAAASRRTRAAPAAPWALLAPLQVGSPLGLGWSIADLEPVRRGASVLVLQGPNATEARVHICRRRGRPHGVAWTGDLDFLLMNGGAGDEPTAEGLGRVLLTLARQVSGPAPEGLLTHDERLDTYADDHEALT